MDNQKFGSFVAALRKEKDLTQSDLARRLNVTDKAVSKWECGAGLPSIEILEPLAEALGVSLLELMRGERISEQAVLTENAEDAVSEVVKAAALQQKKEKLRKRQSWGALLIFAVGILLILNSVDIGQDQAITFLKAMGSMDTSSYNIIILSCASSFRAIGFAVCLLALVRYFQCGKKE